jgi:hypothetical protein
MTEIKKQRTIKVRPVTGDQINFLSDKSGYSKAELMAQIFDNLFNIACNLTEGFNVAFDYDVSEPNAVKIVFDGKSNMIIGEQKMPNSVLEEEKKAGIVTKAKFKDSKGFVEVKQP